MTFHNLCVAFHRLKMAFHHLKLLLHHLAMPFGQLIFWKIMKIVATISQILGLKCSKFYFGWGSAQDPTGQLTAIPDPVAGYVRGLFIRGGWGRRGGNGTGQEGRKGRG